MIGTGVAAACQPNDAEANVFYVGASGQICSRFWSNSGKPSVVSAVVLLGPVSQQRVGQRRVSAGIGSPFLLDSAGPLDLSPPNRTQLPGKDGS